MENRKPKNTALRKLILTGSFLAENSLNNVHSDKKLAETWEKLLKECNEQGLLNTEKQHNRG